MATQFKLEHHFPEISVELFEKYLNHPRLCEMLGEMPAFKGRQLLDEKTEADGGKRWKFKVSAGGDIPASIQKLIPEEMMSWHEISTFVPAQHCINFVIEPLKGPGKFGGKGAWKLKKHGQGTKRIIEGEIEVKIPFVGKIVESFLVEELKRNYEKEPDIQRRFYAEMNVG